MNPCLSLCLEGEWAVSDSPQHLVLETIWSSIISIQPNTPEDGHIDARNM